MSQTTTLQKVINGTKSYLRNQPLDFANLEPALEAGNIVLQTILGPPFGWAFNRATFTLPVTAAASDYSQVLPDFGFLETQWITDANNTVHELTGALRLPVPTSNGAGRPTRMALQKDDSNGNLTFRLDKMPAAAYTITGDYQRKAPLITSPATVLPLPDHLRHIFDWGFLTLVGQLVNDARVPWWEKLFTSRLLATQDGLEEQDISIFLGTWQANMRTMTRTQAAVNAGAAGRQQ